MVDAPTAEISLIWFVAFFPSSGKSLVGITALTTIKKSCLIFWSRKHSTSRLRACCHVIALHFCLYRSRVCVHVCACLFVSNTGVSVEQWKQQIEKWSTLPPKYIAMFTATNKVRLDAQRCARQWFGCVSLSPCSSTALSRCSSFLVVVVSSGSIPNGRHCCDYNVQHGGIPRTAQCGSRTSHGHDQQARMGTHHSRRSDRRAQPRCRANVFAARGQLFSLMCSLVRIVCHCAQRCTLHRPRCSAR